MPDAGSIDSDPVRYLVTLVHGTFARNAPWTHDDSKLCTGLRAAIGGGVCFRPFPWSGHNSVIGRAEASEELAKQIADDVRQYPSARQFVIAHSHGGNFALSAAADARLVDKIAGVVCLSTPFLVSRKRDLGKDPLAFAVGMVIVVVLASVAIVDAVVDPLGWASVWKTTAKFALLLPIGTILFLALGRWLEYGQRIERAMATTATAIDPEGVLIVRSPADEASGLLITGQFASQITVRVFLAAQRMYAGIESFARRWAKRWLALAGIAVVLIAAAVLFLSGYALATNPGHPQWMRTGSLVGFYASLLPLVFVLTLPLGSYGLYGATFPARLAVAVLTWPIILLLSLFLVIPFGWEVAVANVLLDASAEATPLGAWTVHTVAPLTSVEIDSDDIPLVHSAIYDNPQVIALISSWMRTRAELDPRTAGR
jgi:hypothetical protein